MDENRSVELRRTQWAIESCYQRGGKGSEVDQIHKDPSDNYEDISWEEFEEALKKKGLAVYKAEESYFLKIMKNKS